MHLKRGAATVKEEAEKLEREEKEKKKPFLK